MKQFGSILLALASLPLLGAAPPRSDVERAFRAQTPARHQGYRDTCAVFSIVAIIEAYLLRDGLADTNLDFSEEWLQYLAGRSSFGESSFIEQDYELIRMYGLADESLYPYSKQVPYRKNPKLIEASDEELLDKASKLYDPAFQAARADARRKLPNLLPHLGGIETIPYEEAKAHLARGEFLLLELDFYCGAWNHNCAGDLGIGRDLTQHNMGVVGFPAPGSLDEKISRQHPSKHSILLIGYDDSVSVPTRVKMNNGELKEFRYQGVFYFKNSLGTYFGKTFNFGGKPYPGFGMITQEYVMRYGKLLKLNWR